jgi:hypothetical protein|tara:strand:- start:69 stop:242 length:174 start_codon:yes stop_codon:yes gene_type:complete
MKKNKKDFKWDGKSRVVTDLYRKNFDEIFGKKIKDDEELEGYYIDDKGIKVLTKKKR